MPGFGRSTATRACGPTATIALQLQSDNTGLKWLKVVSGRSNVEAAKSSRLNEIFPVERHLVLNVVMTSISPRYILSRIGD